MSLIGASTGWYIGLVLGIIVAAVAAAIVITIVLLARRISAQARTAVEGVEKVRAQTDGLAGVGRINDSGVRILHSARAPQSGGGQVIALAAFTNHDAWAVALVIGLVVALAVAGLLIVLVRTVGDIRKSVAALLDVAGKVAGNTQNIPQLGATAPVLGLIVEEAVIQDGYMNALTDGFGNGNGDR